MASRPPSPDDEAWLLGLVQRPISLFCVLGVACEAWETAMDLLLTDPSRRNTPHITTTSHPDESLQEVMELAELWSTSENSEVEVHQR